MLSSFERGGRKHRGVPGCAQFSLIELSRMAQTPPDASLGAFKVSGSLRLNSGYVFTFLFFLGRRRSVCFSASVGDTFLGFATELSDFQQRGVSFQASPPDSEKPWLRGRRREVEPTAGCRARLL